MSATKVTLADVARAAVVGGLEEAALSIMTADWENALHGMQALDQKFDAVFALLGIVAVPSADGSPAYVAPSEGADAFRSADKVQEATFIVHEMASILAVARRDAAALDELLKKQRGRVPK